MKALNSQEVKSVQTPGEDERVGRKRTERFNNQNASQFWALAARANYLALDRPDVQYAVKEICRVTPPEVTSVDSGGLGVTSCGAPEASGASSFRTPAES